MLILLRYISLNSEMLSFLCFLTNSAGDDRLTVNGDLQGQLAATRARQNGG